MMRWFRYIKETDPSNAMAQLDPNTIGTPDEEITSVLDVSPYVELRISAAQSHRSQRSPFDMLPRELVLDALGKDFWVLELYHRDLLIKEIAPILGCSRYTVTSRLREAGISAGEGFSRSMRLHWRGKYHCREDITVERVFNLYRNGDLPIKEMAKTLGCNPATVRKRLMETGISKSERFSRSARIRRERKARKVRRVMGFEPTT